ncbi:hypothetical protein ACIGZJ_05150 [Kitasatospora sp. NPDC052868]|uniref:hypothetical protein n=1 Tax=Kitasatospora sp. NPDC052868 TaxID=3364060 RepID=UPI0037C835AD
MPSYTAETLKVLYASAVHCAYPTCHEPLTVQDRGSHVNTAEIAHIRSGQKRGPRYDPAYSQSLLNRSENLLLLCRPHHLLVDRGDYPLVELLMWKTDQEQQAHRAVAAVSVSTTDFRLHVRLQTHAARRALLIEINQAVNEADSVYNREMRGLPATGFWSQEWSAAMKRIDSLCEQLLIIGPDWLYAAARGVHLTLIMKRKYGRNSWERDPLSSMLRWFARMANQALADPDCQPADLRETCPMGIYPREPVALG